MYYVFSTRNNCCEFFFFYLYVLFCKVIINHNLKRQFFCASLWHFFKILLYYLVYRKKKLHDVFESHLQYKHAQKGKKNVFRREYFVLKLHQLSKNCKNLLKLKQCTSLFIRRKSSKIKNKKTSIILHFYFLLCT